MSPNAGVLRWEPVFHGVVTERFVMMPAAGGDVMVLRRGNGRMVRRIQPFGEKVDANKYVVGPLTLDDVGNVYYNVMQLDADDPWGEPAWDGCGGGMAGEDQPARGDEHGELPRVGAGCSGVVPGNV